MNLRVSNTETAAIERAHYEIQQKANIKQIPVKYLQEYSAEERSQL